MKLEDFEKAERVIRNMRDVDSKIKEIEMILNDGCCARISGMTITIYTDSGNGQGAGCKTIDHCGLLPEFLRMILEKRKKEYKELEKELAEI